MNDRLPKRRSEGRGLYLHGDIAVDGRAFCYFCDKFQWPQHFLEQHDQATNINLYQRGLAALEHLRTWARVIPSARRNLFEQEDVEIIINDLDMNKPSR